MQVEKTTVANAFEYGATNFSVRSMHLYSDLTHMSSSYWKSSKLTVSCAPCAERAKSVGSSSGDSLMWQNKTADILAKEVLRSPPVIDFKCRNFWVRPCFYSNLSSLRLARKNSKETLDAD